MEHIPPIYSKDDSYSFSYEFVSGLYTFPNVSSDAPILFKQFEIHPFVSFKLHNPPILYLLLNTMELLILQFKIFC